MGAASGTLQAPGLVVPAVSLPAARPSHPAGLSAAWRASGRAAGPRFTAVCPASFLTEAAVCKDLHMVARTIP